MSYYLLSNEFFRGIFFLLKFVISVQWLCRVIELEAKSTKICQKPASCQVKNED